MPKSYSGSFRTKFTMKRVTSVESLQHSPKTFTEEVADALGVRARALGNSHPSVILGKEKRLIESLLNVKEALKTAKKKTEEKPLDLPPSPCSSSPAPSATSSTASITRLVAGDCMEQGTLIKTRITPVRSNEISRTPLKERDNPRNASKSPYTAVEKEIIKFNGRESNFIYTKLTEDNPRNVSKSDWTAVEKELIEFNGKEPNSIHMRLTQDMYGTSTPGYFGIKEKACFRCSRKTPKIAQQVQPSKQRNQTTPYSITPEMPTSFLKEEDREAIRNIFENSLNSPPPTTKNKKSLGERIRDVANRRLCKTVRKRVGGAVSSGMRGVERAYERVKNIFVKPFRK